MKYIITIIITMFLFSCSGKTLNNAASSCEPKWFPMKYVSWIQKLIGKKDSIESLKYSLSIVFWDSYGPVDILRTRVCAKRPTE